MSSDPASGQQLDLRPAAQLLSHELENGWRVDSEIERLPNATGGNFSHCYIVRRADGTTAFLKAFDYSAAIGSPDPARMLLSLTAAFMHEKALCKLCAEKKLTHVVRALDAGNKRLDTSKPLSIVEYLIFEKAIGDVRTQLDVLKLIDDAWLLRTAHGIAVGLKQLHGQGIAHQDLKPSNVLVFEAHPKLADLGRASWRGNPVSHDDFDIAGDPGYAPPESLYGYLPPEFATRRFGCDFYLLGSMITFLFTRTSISAQLTSSLAPAHHWSNWTGTFQEVLPYLQGAFAEVMIRLRPELPTEVRDDLLPLLRALCDPDPTRRGDSAAVANGGSQYSLDRVVSTLDMLAYKCEIRMKRQLRNDC